MLLRNGLRRLQESGRPRRPGPGAGPATAVRTLTRSACGLLSSPPALESLAAKKERVDRPVRHQRAAAALRPARDDPRHALRREGLLRPARRARQDSRRCRRQDIVNERRFKFSACELTKSTGLSLTETLVREAGEGEGIGELVGEATSFFSYSWTGTKLRDLLAAIERVLAKLEAADGKVRVS